MRKTMRIALALTFAVLLAIGYAVIIVTHGGEPPVRPTSAQDAPGGGELTPMSANPCIGQLPSEEPLFSLDEYNRMREDESAYELHHRRTADNVDITIGETPGGIFFAEVRDYDMHIDTHRMEPVITHYDTDSSLEEFVLEAEILAKGYKECMMNGRVTAPLQ